jgi:hypothetical protein
MSLWGNKRGLTSVLFGHSVDCFKRGPTAAELYNQIEEEVMANFNISYTTSAMSSNLSHLMAQNIRNASQHEYAAMIQARHMEIERQRYALAQQLNIAPTNDEPTTNLGWLNKRINEIRFSLS